MTKEELKEKTPPQLTKSILNAIDKYTEMFKHKCEKSDTFAPYAKNIKLINRHSENNQQHCVGFSFDILTPKRTYPIQHYFEYPYRDN